MYSFRINNRLPQVSRVCRPAACNSTRSMSLFPRFVGNDFAPVFRLIDDYTNQIANRPGFDVASFTNRVRAFNPRFDVKETDEAYELLGELPGIDQNDINIEFTDPQTISIKGRTETHREEGTKPVTKAVEGQSDEVAALPEAETEKVDAPASEASETSSYHKPTVEDFEVIENPEAGPSNTTDAQPKAAANAEAKPTEAPAEQQQQQEQQPEGPRYWVSERSVGQFHRSFAFPSRVDQENVRASLKDGILSIVVPKAAVPQSRRINIE